MFQAALAADNFEYWLRDEAVAPEDAEQGVKLSWMTERFLQVDDGIPYVLGDYHIYLQMVLVILGRMFREPTRYTVKVDRSDERVALMVPPDDWWIESLSADTFQRIIYEHSRRPDQEQSSLGGNN
jgi:hypothetical protein